METKASNLALTEVVEEQEPNPLLDLLDDEKVKSLVALLKEADLTSDLMRLDTGDITNDDLKDIISKYRKLGYFVRSRNPKSVAAAYQILNDYLDEDTNDSGKFERFGVVHYMLVDLLEQNPFADPKVTAWGESLESAAGLTDEGIIHSIARGARKAVEGVKAIFVAKEMSNDTPYFGEIKRLYDLKSSESAVETTYQALLENCNVYTCRSLQRFGCYSAHMDVCLAEAYEMVFGSKLLKRSDWTAAEYLCFWLGGAVDTGDKVKPEDKLRIQQVVEVGFAKYCALKVVGSYRGGGVFMIK